MKTRPTCSQQKPRNRPSVILTTKTWRRRVKIDWRNARTPQTPPTSSIHQPHLKFDVTSYKKELLQAYLCPFNYLLAPRRIKWFLYGGNGRNGGVDNHEFKMKVEFSTSSGKPDMAIGHKWWRWWKNNSCRPILNKYFINNINVVGKEIES